MTANKVAFPPLHSSEIVLTLPPDGWVCPLEEHSILSSSWPRCFRPRKPCGPWVSVWNLLPDGRGCTFMPCPQQVSSLGCPWESSEVALPAGTPLPRGSPLAKQPFFLLMPRVSVWGANESATGISYIGITCAINKNCLQLLNWGTLNPQWMHSAVMKKNPNFFVEI